MGGPKSNNKKKAKKKSSGPKGKRARAKSKLDRVWGESYDVNEREASRVRIGRSRRPLPAVDASVVVDAAAAAAANEEREGMRTPVTIVADDDDDDDEDDEVDGGGGMGPSPLSTLLRRIRGTRNDDGDNHDDDDDNDDDDVDDDVDDDDDDDDDVDDDNDDGIEDASSGATVATSPAIVVTTPSATTRDEDPYDAHFSRDVANPTSSEPMSSSLDGMKSIIIIPPSIMSFHPSSGGAMEVSLAGRLLDAWEDHRARAAATTTADAGTWEGFAYGPYKHVRKVLLENWDVVNKSSLAMTMAKRQRRRRLLSKTQLLNNDVLPTTEDGDDYERAPSCHLRDAMTPLQMAIYPAISRYADVLITSETRKIYNVATLHVLNHVLTSRTRVQRHNRRIKELALNEDGGDDDEDVDRWRDQGYTRPKVLVLLPTRSTCYEFVKSMTSLLGSSAILDNWDKFHDEYGPAESVAGEQEEDGEEDDSNEEEKNSRRAAVLRQKGPEWNELFGDDINADDDFKMGLSITPNFVNSSSHAGGGKKRRASRGAGSVVGGEVEGVSTGVNVKLCAEFYRSDIILASPIGLKMTISGGDEDDDDGEEADVDFLSSIDVCLVVRSDVLLMQNWDHVNSVLDSLNRQPRKVADIDFSRVRNYFLEGRGSNWRQLILVSQFASPRILSTFRRCAKNVEGSLRMMRRTVRLEDASVSDVAVRGLRQVFQRVTCKCPSEAGSDRLRYFSEHILPKLTRLRQKHTLIYVPSYFDFIKLRNLLLKREADFVSITEYARVSEVSRGRARFLQGRKSIMLYTGRAHFFLRHKIKGARHLIFFGLPEYAEFYPAVVNMLNGGSSHDNEEDGGISTMQMSCLSLFTKFDAHQLERIVSTSNAERMIKQGEKSSFMFSS
ncbi:hypothetical protein ACHAXA_000452 [Cyclostephanos tholiformis]|uniref:U3 small nucleolar RNA-associated protein 25 n=1 Tax=Cyclostephanos tholiformis TaxID=382380 RepID=A0ABD3RVX9_9STRA